MTTVCNVKVKHIKPKYNNLREWMADPNNVYVGRSNVVFVDGERFPKVASIWANPFKIKAGATREQVIAQYRAHFIARLDADPALVVELLALRGKQLGCWCYPEACHADVLVELIDLYGR